MKIGVLSNNYPPDVIGGAEIYAKTLADEVSKYHEIFVFAGKYDLNKRYTRHNISAHKEGYWIYRMELGTASLDYRTVINFFDPLTLLKARKIFRKEKPDILHAHNLAGISMSPLYSYKRIPSVMTLHDFWLICPKNTLLKNDDVLCRNGGRRKCENCNIDVSFPLFKISTNTRNKIIERLSRKLDLFISPSKKLKEIMDERGYGFDVLHIPYGINLEKLRRIGEEDKIDENEINILMLGVIAPHKGVYILLEAIKDIFKNLPNIKLFLAGVREEKTNLVNYLKRNKMMEKVVLINWFNSEEKKISLLKKADIFVQPSIWVENFPLTVIEAMVSGLPVVGSDVGGIPELVDDKKTGHLFKVGNSADLKSKLVDLISDSHKRKKMGEAGRKKVLKNYEIKTHAKKIMKIYEGLA
jgi:glycosyltransferase involved in cell wall biosynthesis